MMEVIIRRMLAAAAALALLVHAGEAGQGSGHDHATDERVARLAAALAIAPGSAVADIGAGGGDYTVRLAREVGPGGRIYAVDVSTSALGRLRSRVASEKLENVQVIEGAADDPRLPAGALDAALIVNAYHEMTEHAAMLARIREALKRNGRLVIVEPIGERERSRARDEQTRQHQIAPDVVLREVKAAGFDVVALEDPFRSLHAHRGEDEWLLVATPAR